MMRLTIFLAMGLTAAAHAHDPPEKFHADYGLIGRWGFDPLDVDRGRVASSTGSAELELHGEARIVTTPDGAFLLNEGLDGWAEIVPAPGVDAASLRPTRAMTAMAWVVVRQPGRWGGIIGALQDNGDAETGWLLGYENDHFSYGLATTGTDDGDGSLTYMTAETPYEKDRWHHVAATYDGETMRLYVNGREAATSREQHGDILHPASASFAVGAYRDANEFYPLTGGIQHIRVYDRCLDPAAIEHAMLATPSMKDAAALRMPFRLLVAPYLQASTKTSMTVMLETNEASWATVEYGATYPPEERATASSESGLFEIRLDDLEPETPYFYRVRTGNDTGDTLQLDDSTFKTAVEDDTAFAFIVMSDTQNNPAVTRVVSDFAWRHRPNFIIHCGDLVGTGDVKREWVYEFFASAADLLRRFPIFPTLGNHERDAQLYYDYFSLPDPEYYYEYEYGNTHFFVLDTNKDVSPESDQHQWLAERLAASDATWKVVYHHQPAFTSDSNDYGDTYKGPTTFGDTAIQSHLVPLYEAHGVDIVFNGHIHVYERTWPLREGVVDQERGIVYVTAGGSGGSLEDFAPTRTPFAAHLYRGHHYAYVTVHAGTFTLKAYDVEGRLFDFVELRKSVGD